MKRILLGALLAVITITPSVFAIDLRLQGGPGGYGPWQTGVGGEFTFQITSPSDQYLLDNYSSVVRNQGGVGNSFQTFCVEGGENINSAYPNYTANLNNHSVYSNVQLTKGAAWLYSQFAQGQLTGYDIVHNSVVNYNYSGDRHTSAGLLQNAIWALMGGQEGQALDLNNPFLAAAAMAIGGSYNLASLNAANESAATGYDGVYVLNVWDSSGKAAQDQLIYSTSVNPNSIGVPDGGMTAMLLGIAFTSTAFISRKLRRQ